MPSTTPTSGTCRANRGWGVNLVQAQSVMFATFFVYGPGNVPTWYTAVLYADANGNFSGNLYATVGTYFGAPWVPGNLVNTQVGTASFVPSSPYQGTLTYSLHHRYHGDQADPAPGPDDDRAGW